MKKFFSWDKADSFCPVEAASPPSNFSSLFTQSRFPSSLTSSTPLFTTNTEPTSLCAQLSSSLPGGTTTQELIIDQLTKLASHQTNKLTPPSDQAPASAASGSSSTSSADNNSCSSEASIPVQQQQQKQINSFLNALAVNSTNNALLVNNNASSTLQQQQQQQQQQQNLGLGNSSSSVANAANLLLSDVSSALIQKTTSDFLGAAAASSLVNSAIGVYGDNTVAVAAAKLSSGLINTNAIQQQSAAAAAAFNSSAQFLGILTGQQQQQQSLPSANQLLSGAAPGGIQSAGVQQHQNPSAASLLQIMNQPSGGTNSSSAAQNLNNNSLMEQPSTIIGKHIMGGGQPSASSAFELVQKATSIQKLLNQKQMIDQQIIQLTLGTTSTNPSQTETSCPAGQLQNQQQTNNLLMDLAGAQHMLKESKPIPLFGGLDLERFRRVSPYQWTNDDVVAWILDVARSHNIPCENISLVKFSELNGLIMLQMKEHDFIKYDITYGSLLFKEFCKTCSSDVMKNWINSNPGGGTASLNEPFLTASLQFQQQQQALQAPQKASHTSPNLLLSAAASHLATEQQKGFSQQGSLLQQLRPSPIGNTTQQLQQQIQHAAQQQLLRPLIQQSMEQLQQQASSSSSALQLHLHQGASTSQQFGSALPPSKPKKGFDQTKIRRNKDGRPRKRSQHTKGNKLWEFIRDALKDPKYCPSVVRWEDPNEGVFRIVESERLAYLWGQKKNNIKMTYEKLSRAMRTYYEKEILVPVPKCGLYPKKLVYKFGPSAHGWRSAAAILQPPTGVNLMFPGQNLQNPVERIGMNINVTTC